MKHPFFERFGGDLSLDFVNTASWPGGAASDDRLADYASLVAWGRGAGLPIDVTPGAGDASEEARVSELARRIRAILHEVLSRAAEGKAPEEKRLGQFNAALSAALDRLGVTFAPRKGFSWTWVWPKGELEQPLWPVLWAAALLLAGGEGRKIRRCASPECGRLYLDRSRRGNRRWCSMKGCGNRAKARRHSARRRARRRGRGRREGGSVK